MLKRLIPGIAGLAASTAVAQSGAPVKALLLTGENNHNWRYTSRVHEDTLEATGLFEVDVAEDPSAALGDATRLGGYGLIVLDYNGRAWSEAAKANLVKAVEGGTGVVVIHASNNAFGGPPAWAEYEKIVGLCWREPPAGHGKFHAFDVNYTAKDNPITNGLAPMSGHPDELYHRLANPQRVKFQTLATALSDTESGGSGNDEPMAITLMYGKGRVFHTPLGHVWEKEPATKASVVDPQFRILLSRGAEWAATGAVKQGAEWKDVRAHNTLSAEEEAAGFTLLFDGKSAGRFRGFKQQGFPAEGWVVEDGALRHAAGKGGGDIITADEYTDFEFACQWKVAAKGNSGIIYRSTEAGGATWSTGPEMQVLDDAGHHDGLDAKTSAGSLYALIAPAYDVVRPAGEWNSARVVISGNRVEHWLNGWKIVEYELNCPKWDEMIRGTKFQDMEGFGRAPAGHIALQDHGDEVSYRDLKVRALPAK